MKYKSHGNIATIHETFIELLNGLSLTNFLYLLYLSFFEYKYTSDSFMFLFYVK